MIRRGFTLIEVIVVLLVIGVMVTLILLPTQGNARERARRLSCENNVRHLVLALLSYHDTFRALPSGAHQRTVALNDEKQTSWGPSWIVATFPFFDPPLHDQVTQTEQLQGVNDYISDALRDTAHNANLKFLICTSSPLPETEMFRGRVLTVPSYAGIMGAAGQPKGLGRVEVKETRLVPGPYGGVVGGGGMLPINESLPLSAATDGAAYVIIVGEVSDTYYSDDGAKHRPSLSLASAGSLTGGWLAGTNLPGTIHGAADRVDVDRVYNLITITQPIGVNNRRGPKDDGPNWETQGIGHGGVNHPLLAAHPVGAMVGFVDGHVQLLTKQTMPHVLMQLGIRDDGGKVSDY